MGAEPLTVVAIFRAKPGREADLETALRAMPAPTRLEIGCLNYDLHRVPSDPGRFFFHENWTTVDDHRAHMQTPHVKRLLSLTPDLLAEPILEFKGERLNV
jgi:quinol monooxygenase YgiN